MLQTTTTTSSPDSMPTRRTILPTMPKGTRESLSRRGTMTPQIRTITITSKLLSPPIIRGMLEEPITILIIPSRPSMLPEEEEMGTITTEASPDMMISRTKILRRGNPLNLSKL